MVKTPEDICRSLLESSDSQDAVESLDHHQIKQVLKYVLVSQTEKDMKIQYLEKKVLDLEAKGKTKQMKNKAHDAANKGEIINKEKTCSMVPSAFDKLFTKNVLHILEEIFFDLDYESFKTCLEVSNLWRQLLTSESFIKKERWCFLMKY